jgi:hypothetical protein
MGKAREGDSVNQDTGFALSYSFASPSRSQILGLQNPKFQKMSNADVSRDVNPIAPSNHLLRKSPDTIDIDFQ